MSGASLFVASVAVYSAIPLVLAIRRTSFQQTVLYAHIAAVLALGGLLGAVYVLPVQGHVALLAGQVSYGGFMFATLVTVIVGGKVTVVRDIIVLTVSVDLLVFLIFQVTHTALLEPKIPNPYRVNPEVFNQSLRTVVLGGVLILCELLALLALIEFAKRRLGRWPMAPVYVFGYVAVLTLDGVLFPTLVLQPSTGLGALITSSVQAKLVLASTFAVPLVIFQMLYPRLMGRFEATPLHLRELLPFGRGPVLARLREQKAELDLATARAARATATVERILDAATNTVLVATDADYRITHFNTGAQKLLGFTEPETLGRSMGNFSDVDQLELHAAHLGVPADLRSVVRELARDGTPRDWALRTKSGEKRVVSLSVTGIREGPEIVGYLCAGEDITGRVRAEEALADALRRELESVARLEEADRVKDEVVSTVSHELRTPITSILGYTELVIDGAFGTLNAQQVEALAKVLRNTSQLSSLVGDLLQLDRAQHGRTELAREPVNLAEVVADAMDTIEQMRASRRLELTVRLPDRAVSILGDRNALERVVLNLVGNACKFTADGGSVEISLEIRTDDAVLVVADTGIGIPEDDQSRILDRFFRSTHAYRHAVPGIGLGLTIVSDVVTQHGGSLHIESAVGVGTTVTVRLPLENGAPV